MADNEWKQPDAPPPPMFAGKKERDLVKQVNDELIERVMIDVVVVKVFIALFTADRLEAEQLKLY